MNSVRSNNVSLKYQRFATLGSKDIKIINSEFLANTQFLYRTKKTLCAFYIENLKSEEKKTENKHEKIFLHFMVSHFRLFSIRNREVFEYLNFK